MNPRSRKMKVGLILISALLVFAIGGSLGAYLSSGSGGSVLSEVGDVLSLSRPAFAQGAGLTFLDEEAGMSIYTNTSQILDLSVAATVYKTIERQTEDYIVGSFALPDQPDSDDVHIFVHKDGWIVVYYLHHEQYNGEDIEPVSKIIDWDYYASGTLFKTKLHVGLEEMCLAFGINPNPLDKQYYHFNYQFANKLMIIIESSPSGEGSFNLKIPSELTLWEGSWSHQSDSETNYGGLISTQLSYDLFHTVAIPGWCGSLWCYNALTIDGDTIDQITGSTSGDGALVLLYSEP